MKRLLGSLALVLMLGCATLAQSYPQIAGPGGVYMPPPAVASLGYDRNGLACVAGPACANTDSPALDAVAVTPSDTTVLANVRSLYVGTTGNVAVEFAGDTTAVVFQSVPAGTILPLAVSQVMNTNTTASNIVALK
jgi:hypothetical protein